MYHLIKSILISKTTCSFSVRRQACDYITVGEFKGIGLDNTSIRHHVGNYVKVLHLHATSYALYKISPVPVVYETQMS